MAEEGEDRPGPSSWDFLLGGVRSREASSSTGGSFDEGKSAGEHTPSSSDTIVAGVCLKQRWDLDEGVTVPGRKERHRRIGLEVGVQGFNIDGLGNVFGLDGIDNLEASRAIPRNSRPLHMMADRMQEVISAMAGQGRVRPRLRGLRGSWGRCVRLE